LRDGRIAYLLKTPRKGRTHRVMTPVEFMARLCAILPAPKYPTVRYDGVFASASRWRPLVVPKPPTGARRPPCPTGAAAEPREPSHPPSLRAASQPSPVFDTPVVEVSPTTLTIKHWRRLHDGALFAASPRIEWATLMQRTFGFDALRCPSCERRMRVMATVT